MTHPASCTDPDCELPYAEHLRGIAIAAAATPYRRAVTANQSYRERMLARDLDAYQRLRRNGVQPRHTDGAARLEATADTRAQVEA